MADRQRREVGPDPAPIQSIGTQVSGRLIESGNPVRYHGDFDWPGVSFKGHVLKQGAAAGRMSAEDYIAAVAALDADHAIALTGRPCRHRGTRAWLQACPRTGLAVHEEFVLSDLLGDLEYR